MKKSLNEKNGQTKPVEISSELSFGMHSSLKATNTATFVT